PEFSRFHVVCEVQRKDFVTQAPHEPGLSDWRKDFYAAIKVSRSQIGAADVNLFLTAIREKINTAVFEEPAHNASHADVLAYGQAGPDAGRPPHNQIDADARHRGLIKQLDHFGIDQRVHLKNEMTVSSARLPIYFTQDQGPHMLAQIQWRYE